tara:strand:+ start:573 stop:1658 length:1086 start_codon:yes stop_codon:yes gene_type:complete
MSSLFENRANKLSNIIADLGYDGFYITNITNIRYLTGFTGSAGLLFILHNQAFFFTDGRYIQQSKQQVQNAEIYIISTNYFDAIKKVIKQFNAGDLKIAFEATHMSYAYYSDLINNFAKIDWIKTDSIIENIAAVKDEDEIAALQTAIDITDEVFTKIIPEIKSGVTEKHIAARISYLFKTHGADGDSYESIIAAGPNSALPHARPTEREFQKGDFIVMDFGALYKGYHADMTRTVLIGTPSDKHQEIYDIVLQSNLNGISTAKSGVPCCDVDFACRSIIDQHGYGELFNHSTGHGIGLEVHTLPRIHKNNKILLEKNHVITIEPGIYIPDWGGVRIEDDCLIEVDRCIPMNKSTKDLISI